MKTALEQVCRIKTSLQYLYSKNHPPFLTSFKFNTMLIWSGFIDLKKKKKEKSLNFLNAGVF